MDLLCFLLCTGKVWIWSIHGLSVKSHSCLTRTSATSLIYLRSTLKSHIVLQHARTCRIFQHVFIVQKPPRMSWDLVLGPLHPWKSCMLVQRIKDKNLWNRALCGKSMKLGMHLYYVSICKFSYSAIADLTLKGRGSHLKMATVIPTVTLKALWKLGITRAKLIQI